MDPQQLTTGRLKTLAAFKTEPHLLKVNTEIKSDHYNIFVLHATQATEKRHH